MGQKRWQSLAAAGLAGLMALVVVGAGAGPGRAAAAATPPTRHTAGGQLQTNFWLATSSGSLLAFGVPSYGSPTGPLNQPVVGVVPSGDQQGYWMVASDGGIFSYGDAHFYGSTGNIRLNRPVVGLAPTRAQRGYWLVASDGGVFSFGDAVFHGSTGNLTLNKPIVGMAATPDGNGYWMVASDGGVFSFGDAVFHGSTGNLTLNQPIVSMAPSPDGRGYWLVAADGGVFTFGDAGFFGSSADAPGDPAQRLAPTRSGQGYWIFRQNGDAAAFGDATTLSPPSTALLMSPVSPGDKAVLFAFEQLGKPYIWGGNGPVGYDCSGLVLASWSHADGIGFARVANDQYHTAGTVVPMSDLQTGDLVFWGHSQTDWTSVYHTALSVGGGRIVEATGDHVQLGSLGQWGMGDLMPSGRRP
ncbi:MAG TPA: C40 family peptidase [Acidimicrobiales bacterium]|nr:C40 family peptidase [Acidimicrobiales bacterium]